MSRVIHQIPPVWNQESQVLILGSFPSVKSREAQFFYHHPQNRFWKVLAGLTKEALPVTVPEKKDFLWKHHIAVWDVIASCEIEGSSDRSIREVVPNDVEIIIKNAPIEKIFTNGATAYEFYQKYLFPKIKREAIKLPSTSPANAAWTLEKLLTAWSVVVNFQ